MPADARFIVHNLLANLNRGSPTYCVRPIGPYVSEASEEWQFAVIMRFVYRDECVSRDSDHDRTWLLILKQKLRVMSGQPRPQAGSSGFTAAAPGCFRSTGPRAVMTRPEHGVSGGLTRERPPLSNPAHNVSTGMNRGPTMPERHSSSLFPSDGDSEESDVPPRVPKSKAPARSERLRLGRRTSQQMMSQEEAEKTMDAFLATFTSSIDEPDGADED
jgi:hypothetical protein